VRIDEPDLVCDTENFRDTGSRDPGIHATTAGADLGHVPLKVSRNFGQRYFRARIGNLQRAD
jgi:hypothetical protein